MRFLSIIIGISVFAGAIAAQTGANLQDPITSTWTGLMGTGATPSRPFTLELKFDGKSGVSGTISKPTVAVIKTGSFDPKTGLLKFEGETPDGGPRLAFEGWVALDTVTGKISGDNQTGMFKLTRTSGETPSAQPSANGSVAAGKVFAEVSGWVTKGADLVPADKYTFRPTPAVRSFGQLVAHVADAYNYYCGQAAGRNVQWSDATEKANLDKATLTQKLKQSLDVCKAPYTNGSQIGPLMENVGHTSQHYGNMVTYLRLLGLTPPSN